MKSMRPALLAGAAALLAIASHQAWAADYSWKIQTNSPSGSLPFQYLEAMIASIETASQGRLEIELLPVNSVVSATETLDAIQNGILDGHETGPVLFSGKDPAFAMLGDLTAGYNDGEQVCAFMRYGGGLELLRELYDPYDAYPIGVICQGPESMISTVPIESLDDLKGLKVRTPPGMEQDVFAKLGATPVGLPATEIYGAIERKVIDAADWGSYAQNSQQGLHEIAGYPIIAGWHSNGVNEISVSKEKWAELPPDLQEIVSLAVRDHSIDQRDRLMIADEEVAAKESAAGITVIRPSAEDRKAVRAVAQTVWQEWSERSEMAKKAYEAHVAFMQNIGLLD
jgi:TRAP-type mannitol/chloroaromatic compound transport system substrate-binding protein